MHAEEMTLGIHHWKSINLCLLNATAKLAISQRANWKSSQVLSFCYFLSRPLDWEWSVDSSISWMAENESAIIWLFINCYAIYKNVIQWISAIPCFLYLCMTLKSHHFWVLDCWSSSSRALGSVHFTVPKRFIDSTILSLFHFYQLWVGPPFTFCVELRDCNTTIKKKKINGLL